MFGHHIRCILWNQSALGRTRSFCFHSMGTCKLSYRTCAYVKHFNGHLHRKEVFFLPKRNASSNASEESSSSRRQALMYAIYGSFAVGGCLWFAIFLKWFNKKRLLFKGIQPMDVPEFKRLTLYKYKDTVLPEFVIKVLDDIEKFETSSDDVWVVSFPRSGTTWLQEIVYLIQSNVNTDRAESLFIDYRFPYLEFMTPGIKEIEKMPKPRLIKSHLPYSLLPLSVLEKKPKIIYIARNPKDVAVSYYYFVRLLYPVTRYDAEFKDFLELFLQDKVMYAPWTNHVLEFWNRRHEDNIFFLTYEDLKRDTAGTIVQLAAFLGKSLTKEQIEKIVEHCSFSSMKNNPATNHSWFETYGVSDPNKGDFMRKGCVGDWANHFTPEMSNKMNRMLAYKFRNSDIDFAYSGTHFVTDGDSITENSNKLF